MSDHEVTAVFNHDDTILDVMEAVEGMLAKLDVGVRAEIREGPHDTQMTLALVDEGDDDEEEDCDEDEDDDGDDD